MQALRIANRGFERRLRLVRDDDWRAATPCTEWDVRALVSHVIGANRRYVTLLHGESASEVDATRTADHIGIDAVASFTTTARESVDAFGEPGALDRVVTHPIGDRSGRELLAMRVLDVAVHTWDLAQAIDADDDLDPDLVEFVLPVATQADLGSFALPTGEPPEESSSQMRLLHMLGRRPTRKRFP